MKTAFLIFILVGITFLGCSDNFENTLVSSPANTEQVTNSSLFTPQLDISDPATQPNIFVSKLIDGRSGGWLKLDTTYINSEGRQIDINARLRILPHSYEGTINIEMAPNDEDVSIQLFPHMVFARKVQLTVVYTGIDLEALGYTTTGDVEFAYFADNGDIELIENQRALVNMHLNRISVRKAKLLHFSRYGWVR